MHYNEIVGVCLTFYRADLWSVKSYCDTLQFAMSMCREDLDLIVHQE